MTIIRTALLLLGVLLLASAATAQDATPTPEPPFTERHAEVIARIQTAPGDVGIACYDVGAPENGVYLNADLAFPLASTYKVVILAAYAQQVTDGTLNPEELVPLDDLNAYLLPGTDGGAHDVWIGGTELVNGALPLRAIPFGMIRFSSNAAADYLLSRVGEDAVREVYAAFGMTDISPPFNFLGHFLLIDNHETGAVDLDSLTPESVDAEAARLANLYLTDPQWRDTQRQYQTTLAERYPSTSAQFLYAVMQIDFFREYGHMGTPRDFAALLAGIYQGDVLGQEASTIARTYLEWPMGISLVSDRFDLLGNKGGSLAGVLTATYYAESPSREDATVLVVFYRDLELLQWVEWLTAFPQQQLELDVLEGGCSLLAEVIASIGTSNPTGS